MGVSRSKESLTPTERVLRRADGLENTLRHAEFEDRPTIRQALSNLLRRVDRARARMHNQQASIEFEQIAEARMAKGAVGEAAFAYAEAAFEAKYASESRRMGDLAVKAIMAFKVAAASTMSPAMKAFYYANAADDSYGLHTMTQEAPGLVRLAERSIEAARQDPEEARKNVLKTAETILKKSRIPEVQYGRFWND